MDSFFKAAVCDLDKLLDDFELNTEEQECKPVFLKPPAYSFPSLPSEASTIPQCLPDLNSLHYGSAPSCPDHNSGHNCSAGTSGVKGQPLTGVDLLSSVDCGPAKTSAPPCPDRALKPVCDLVNDTSSAILVRANSHDAFSELDMVEKKMEEEGGLLVDFSSPAVAPRGEDVGRVSLATDHRDTKLQQESVAAAELLGLDSQGNIDGYAASLSLLDVILPAEVERGYECADTSPSTTTAGCLEVEAACGVQQVENSLGHCEKPCTLPAAVVMKDDTKADSSLGDKAGESLGSHDTEPPTSLDSLESEPAGLSCLPLTVSMCGALINPQDPEDESEQAAEQESENEGSESTEADVCSALEAPANASPSGEMVDLVSPASQQNVEEHHPCTAYSNTPRFNPVSSSLPDTNPVDPPEFGFDCLPESDQAELLVTDEELDAFLQAQTEAEQVERISHGTRCREWDQPESLSELSGDLEDRLVEEELRSQARPEGPEGLASSESDRAMSVSLEESFNPAQESHSSYQVEPNGSSHATHSVTSNYIQPQHSGSPDPQPSYGGARPKQLYCQTHRSSPPADEEEYVGQTDMSSGSSKGCCTVEDGENNKTFPLHPYPQEGHSGSIEPTLLHPPQEHHKACMAYDELSEPPPYPGEPFGDGPKSVDVGAEVEGLGCRQPSWVPDAEAPNCMNCLQKFTFTRRRHHCRACGKVYCAVCCNRKCKLKYLEKEARVCIICFDTIHRAQALERMMSPTGPSPNPNVPSEYCSTIPPLQQARAAGTLNSPPPTVMVPVSVLKHPSNDSCPREQKRVWFADGILPNGEVADTTKLSVPSRRSPQESSLAPDLPTSDPASSEAVMEESSVTEASEAVEVVRPPVSGPWDYALLCGIASSRQRASSLLPEDEEGLPPLLISTVEDDAGDVLMEQRPAPSQILLLLEEGGPRPLTFVLNANLLVNVKLLTYCSRRCWLFGSNGLQALGQREIVFVLECLPEEKTLPKDLFILYLNIYQDALKGRFVEDLGNVTFTSSFLGSKEHGGMVFFSPTCQPLEGLTLPPQPFLFGLLIQRLEVPWAKVFPLRLLLRLGAEHSVYPTTLVSIRFRDSVYRETGHTIMNLLSDLRNYQYSLPVVDGLRIHMEMGHSYIDIPKSRFNEMLKVVNASNEHVISVGASFSSEADSHLVCFQNEEGSYQTQANSMPGKTRTVTGASFVVFNGALKASSGFIAKSSIVEDGLMLQIPPETMESLRTALREQTDFHIPCGKNDGGELRENVTVRWVDWCAPVNAGITSQVDGRPLDGVHSVRVQQDTEFESEGRTIRCAEVFYQLKNPDCCLATVLPSCGVFQREMALAACSALAPHLAVLTSGGINSLSLRVSTQADMVEYQAGSRSKLLPQRYMNELDSALIPVIHGGCASVPQAAMDMEFTFYITQAI